MALLPLFANLRGMECVPTCQDCGERIGVYERAVVFDGAQSRTTSLAAEPDLASGEAELRHYACALRRLRGSSRAIDAHPVMRP